MSRDQQKHSRSGLGLELIVIILIIAAGFASLTKAGADGRGAITIGVDPYLYDAVVIGAAGWTASALVPCQHRAKPNRKGADMYPLERRSAWVDGVASVLFDLLEERTERSQEALSWSDCRWAIEKLIADGDILIPAMMTDEDVQALIEGRGRILNG